MTAAKGTSKDPASPGDDLAAKVKAAQADDSRLVELQKKIVELQSELSKAKETASRASAELQNVKIRLDREAQEMRKFAAEGVLRRFLPTIDNLQRALKSLPEDLSKHSWVRGIVALEQEFLKQVGDMGLKRFESLGKPVDALRHEVLMQGEGPSGQVIEVIEEGYELHDKVVRPAKVKTGGAVTSE